MARRLLVETSCYLRTRDVLQAIRELDQDADAVQVSHRTISVIETEKATRELILKIDKVSAVTVTEKNVTTYADLKKAL
jgi:DNA-binding XRE family transcriptional regulator